MIDKSKRLKALISIIKDNKISNQNDFLHHLEERGFVVTQATLSRDLKKLKAGKVSDGEVGSYYVIPSVLDQEDSTSINTIEGFISIDFSGNICIIRTLPAFSQAIAATIDNAKLFEILGTIAGDDTILIVMRNGVSGVEFTRALVEKIPSLRRKIYK